MANNLTHLLLLRGQKMEAGQLLRDTLALCWRVLDQTHAITPSVLRKMRALGSLVTSREDSPLSAWYTLFYISRGLAVFLVSLAYLTSRKTVMIMR